MQRVRKAVIPAAGLGTRFLPATKAIPKEMLPIVDKPTIQYVVEEAVSSGLENIVFVTSQGKSAIGDHFDYDLQLDLTLKAGGKQDLWRAVDGLSRLIAISEVRQKKPLGLGHAVLVTEPFVGSEPFCVFLGDDIIDSEVPAMKQMLEIYSHSPGSIVAVEEVPWETVSRYGIVGAEPVQQVPGLFRVREMIEKPPREEAPSNLAIIGRYILSPTIFETLRHTTPGAIGEIQLTDGIRGLMERGEPVYAYKFEGKRFDAGDKLGFLMATVTMALKRPDLGVGFREFLKSLNL